MYTEINSQVEAFFNSQGFAKVTIQPEFPQTPNPSLEDITSCTLKCKVSILFWVIGYCFIFKYGFFFSTKNVKPLPAVNLKTLSHWILYVRLKKYLSIHLNVPFSYKFLIKKSLNSSCSYQRCWKFTRGSEKEKMTGGSEISLSGNQDKSRK